MLFLNTLLRRRYDMRPVYFYKLAFGARGPQNVEGPLPDSFLSAVRVTVPCPIGFIGWDGCENTTTSAF